MRNMICFCVCALIAVSVCAAAYANDKNPPSLTFAQAADMALAYSAELRQARSSLALREGMWRWGLRAYFPQISLSASENDRLQMIGADSFVKNYGISLDQLLWDGGRTSTARKLERMELNLLSGGLNRMSLEIVDQTLSVYRNVLSSRTILEIKKSALVVLEEQRRILNEEVLLGLALPVDLAGADVNLSSARLEIISLQLDLTEMERQFAEILGLDVLPVLSEKIDVNRSISLPFAIAVGNLAKERNPDLTDARFSITKKQAEVKFASNSWIPSLRLTGNFSLTGQRYPLTRYNWSVGINIDLSGPWIQNRSSAQAGWEPPYDRTAMAQNNLVLLPDPASAFGVKQAQLALALEREKYNVLFERIGRVAANAVEKCALADKKRLLALEAVRLGTEKSRIEEIKLGLGHITRLELMETLIEQTQREVSAVQAAIALLEAERELEKFLDLMPGELAKFAASAGATQQRRDL
ncbi:TolC family protein [Treponema sp. R6D11]